MLLSCFFVILRIHTKLIRNEYCSKSKLLSFVDVAYKGDSGTDFLSSFPLFKKVNAVVLMSSFRIYSFHGISFSGGDLFPSSASCSIVYRVITDFVLNRFEATLSLYVTIIHETYNNNCVVNYFIFRTFSIPNHQSSIV